MSSKCCLIPRQQRFSLSGWPGNNKCLTPLPFKLCTTFGTHLNGRKSRAQSPFIHCKATYNHTEHLDRSYFPLTAKIVSVCTFHREKIAGQTAFFHSLQSFVMVGQALVRAWSANLPWRASKYYLVSHSIFLFCFVQQVAQ